MISPRHCQPWCVELDHQQARFREDQTCLSDPVAAVVLYLENPEPCDDGANWIDPQLSVSAVGRFNEHPHVGLQVYLRGVDREIRLTADEARRVAAGLTATAAIIDPNETAVYA